MTRVTINPKIRHPNFKPATKLAERLYQWLATGGQVCIR